MRKHRLIRPLIAGLAAIATLATGGAAYAAGIQPRGGGGGNRPGDGTGTDDVGTYWAYSDGNDGAFGGHSMSSIDAAFASMGVTMIGERDKAQGALDDANANCTSRFDVNHPDQRGHAQCRVVGVGVKAMSNGKRWSGEEWSPKADYINAWLSGPAQGTWSNHGYVYKTDSAFSDDTNNTVNKIVDQYSTDTASIVVVMLDQYEPKPADRAPDPPSKNVQDGVSADSMTNHTTISTGTGNNGKQLRFRDTFHPDGQRYTVSRQKVTDGDSDISDRFSFSASDGSTPAGDAMTATWKGGDLPTDHTFTWGFDVTVADPKVSSIKDTGDVWWKGSVTEADQNTPERRFPTWRPNPDKSWVRRDPSNGRWQTVVDPGHTNATGADNMKFLDGDTIGSVVNGTVDAHLIEAPSKLALSDDWGRADYLVDPQDASKARVYEADAPVGADGHYTSSSIQDVTAKGRDVTAMFDITVKGHEATATAKPAYLAKLKGMAQGKQVTMLVPMTVRFSNAQARADHDRKPGEELTFCTNPDGSDLTNSGSETINGQGEPTNTPKVCGYVPPIKKQVVSEGSQGGGQEDIDGRKVLPGQRIEYRVRTEPQLPSDLAYDITDVGISDTYDARTTPDKQTLEATDLTTGDAIPHTAWTVKWDASAHSFIMTFDKAWVKANWKPGSHPRILVRFEATVDRDAPADHVIDNQAWVTVDNSVTPSNIVHNPQPDIKPGKGVTQERTGVDVDGRTFLAGDRGEYHLTLDAHDLGTLAYRMQRLGMVDDYDESHLTLDPEHIKVSDKASGADVTAAFNIQAGGGIVYVFAKTVDTVIPATGETVKGDPQPKDLAEYSMRTLDPLHQPYIDQALLGRSFDITLPFTVTKADGATVSNTATQVTDSQRTLTNTVTNPVEPIEPSKDVVVQVGGPSVDGGSVYLNRLFLYQLDSSVLPAHRAYPRIDEWTIDDTLDPKVDQYTGQWAVYATRDLHSPTGATIASKGQRIAGSGFDWSLLGVSAPLFTCSQDASGKVTVASTGAYRTLASQDDAHEQGWRAYIQVKRLKVTERQENRFTERYNGKALPSNVVWTRTPDMTPSLHIEKFDTESGFPKGDRDAPKDALTVHGDTDITFRITNTSKVDSRTGEGAWFKASDLKLEDATIAGDGKVESIAYPKGWDSLVLKPGQSVDVHGTLKGVATHHTDRAQVHGVPLVECPAAADPAQGEGPGGGASTRSDATPADSRMQVEGRTLCTDTKVDSNQDDWNGIAPARLSLTGSSVATVGVAMMLLASCGLPMMLAHRRRHGLHARRR